MSGSIFPGSLTSQNLLVNPVDQSIENGGRMTRLMSDKGVLSQIIVGLLIVILLYIIFVGGETIYNYINRININRTELLPYSYNTEDKTYMIIQNPNDPNSNPVNLSDNERSGPEFTYSFFLNVHSATFRQEYGLLHIFHKGNPGQYPLLGPGVYMRSDTNCLRVYMNSYKTWNNYVEVENFPVGKWVHIAVICKATAVSIFINGNLKKRMSFDGYQPYQNYGNICAFSQRIVKVPSTVPSLDNGQGEPGFQVFGVMKGELSRLNYFNYALSYSEIMQMMDQGPSSTFAGATDEPKPPYLADTWWTQR